MELISCNVYETETDDILIGHDEKDGIILVTIQIGYKLLLAMIDNKAGIQYNGHTLINQLMAEYFPELDPEV